MQASAMAWDDVRLFLALCRSRTGSGAARLLGVDASTVSRRLAALERTVEATLFDRGRDGVTPTKAAEDLLAVAEEIEDGIGRFSRAAEGLEREVAGRVRITCPADLAEVALAPLLGELLAAHAALRVDLVPGETVLDLTRREADLALRTVRPARGDLVVTRLVTVPWVPVAARARTVRAMTDTPWIGWGERTSSVPPARWLARHLRGAEPVVRSDSLRVQVSLCAAGVGVALVPGPSVAAYGLVPVKLAPALRADLPQDDLFLVTHRALREVPRVRAVWELLVARLR